MACWVLNRYENGTVSMAKSGPIDMPTHCRYALMRLLWKSIGVKLPLHVKIRVPRFIKIHLSPILRFQILPLKPSFEMAALAGKAKTKTIMGSKRKATIWNTILDMGAITWRLFYCLSIYWLSYSIPFWIWWTKGIVPFVRFW